MVHEMKVITNRWPVFRVFPQHASDQSFPEIQNLMSFVAMEQNKTKQNTHSLHNCLLTIQMNIL